MNSKVSSYFESIHKAYSDNANEANAPAMRKYMKDKFAYFGIKKPFRRAIDKNIFITNPKLTSAESIDLVQICFAADERELQYFAIDYLQKNKKLWNEDYILLFEELITTKSWWDSVDTIAARLVGEYFIKFPEREFEFCDKWIHDGNLWLARTAIIHQLFYKQKTNFEKLKEYCLIWKHSDEFFIRKGIGWALRHYSRTNPEGVKEFVAWAGLKKLSEKEALRLMIK